MTKRRRLTVCPLTRFSSISNQKINKNRDFDCMFGLYGNISSLGVAGLIHAYYSKTLA